MARRGFPVGRLAIAGVIAAISLISYCMTSDTNPVTDEKQHVAMSVDQEIAMGLQAAPEMAQQHGGVTRDDQARQRVDRIGRRLVEQAVPDDHPWNFEFHVLADPKTINAFALPGGQVFITQALLDKLSTDGEVAGVLAHEIGHVIERHGSQHLATAQLTQGLTGAAVIAAYDPNNPNSRQSAQVAAAIGQLVNMSFSREDELESDEWGVKLTTEAGYDPRAMIGLMKVLAEAGGGRQPEFFSTHPNPDNRVERIERAIEQQFPDGVPEDLEP